MLSGCGASTGLDLGDRRGPASDGDADADADGDAGADGDADGDGPADPCGSAWTVMELAPWGGGAASVALDADGRLHVVYVRDDPPGVVEHATRRDDGAFEADEPGVVGASPALAFDADGVAHLAVGGDGGIRHLAAPDWDAEVVASSISAAGSPIALGADGALRIAFHDDATEEVVLAVRRDGTWSVETVEAAADPRGTASDHLELALRGDVANLAYVTTACDRGCLPEVRLATDDGGTWAAESVAEARERPSIAVAPDGTVHIASFAPDGSELVHAVRSADGWASEIVATGGGATSCMAIGADGAVLVAYWSRGDLWSARRVPEGWALRTVVRSGVVPSCAIAIDERGREHIVFVDDAHGDGREGAIRHATRTCD